MTKISVYNIDEYVTADDKWIGTDVNTYNKTKNFTPRKLSNYFNGSQVINTGVDLLYKYFTITPPETRPTGTLSFETEIGQTVNFSAISTFLLSKTTLKGNDVVEFLNFLVGTKVLLYKAKNINLFGNYNIVSVEEYLPEPNFLVVNVEFIDGNGFIEEDEDYMISIIDISGGGGGSQNLQDVVNIGNGISNYGGVGTASIQSTNFSNNRTLYLNNNAHPTIKLEDNLNSNHYTVIDIDTLNLSGVSYNWSSIVGGSQDLQQVTDEGATTTNGISIDTGDTYEIGLYAISSAIGVKGESRETYGVYGTSSSSVGVYGNSDNGYGVQGNSDNGVAVYGSSQDQIGVQGNSVLGTAISAYSDYGTGLFSASTEGIGVSAYSTTNIGLQVNGNGTIAIEANLGNSNKGLVINSGTSSTGNFIELDKNGVDKLVVNQDGELTATKLIKEGGSPSEILAADGSVITAGTNITITGGTISSTGGGGSQDLQDVTDIDATTTNPITITANTSNDSLQVTNTGIGNAIKAISASDEGGFNAISAYAYNAGGAAGYFWADACNALIAQTTTAAYPAVEVYAQGNSIYAYSIADTVAVLNQTLNNKGLVINSGASSTGNFIELTKNSVNKLTVNQAGELTAQKLIKEGGFDYQFLKADGSVDNNTYLTSADLPSTLDLYATTSPDPVIAGYTALVRNIADSRYNTVAVDVPTPLVNGTLAAPTLCGVVISDPSILLGNPGVFNFTVIGNIRRVSGSTSSGADFFYSIYKRDLAGTEVFIADSAKVPVPANGGFYIEYISTALWNNGIFLSTDRVVLKFYGIQTGGGTGAYYEFLFGGSDPVRGTAAISSAIIPNIYLKDLADVEKIPALNNEVLYWNDSASLWEHSLVENLVPLATATQKGLVSTTDQTFAGNKTFTGATSIVTNSIDLGIQVNSNDVGIEVNALGIGIEVYGVFAPAGVFNLASTNASNIVEFKKDYVVKALVSNDGLITGTGLNASGQTINTIASFDANKNVVSLPTATYPSLTELTYVKGVTSGIQSQFSGKQDTLQSTVNIKSINGNSILGSGDLTISASPASQSAYTILANNTNASAVPTTQVYKDIAEQTYSGTITWSTTAPTTILSNTYKWNQVGSLVTVRLSLSYSVAGSNTQVIISLPTDLPTPSSPTGFTGASDILYYGTGSLTTTTSLIAATSRVVLLRRNAANNGYEFVITISAAVSIRVAHLTLQYFT